MSKNCRFLILALIFLFCGCVLIGCSDENRFDTKDYIIKVGDKRITKNMFDKILTLNKSGYSDDIIKKINQQNKAVVSFSFSSADDKISRFFEPGVPSPSKRFETIKKIKQAGISCGIFLMPVIPLITDTQEKIEQTLEKAKEAGIDFVLFGTMTLKTGRQKDYFMNFLNKNIPNLVPLYNRIYYKDSQWGESSYKYINYAGKNFREAINKYKIPKRIPPHIYTGQISRKDLILIILEHLDYLLKFENQKSSYGYAAYALSKIKEPIENLSQKELLEINGVGQSAVNIIKEIIDTGKCSYYDSLI